MPAAVAVPAIASVVGAGVGAYGQHKATQAQSKANQQALAFQREQEAARKANFDKAMAAYEQKWNAWNASRNALLQRYGINVQSATPSGMMGGGAPMTPPGAIPRSQAPPGMPSQPMPTPQAPSGGVPNIPIPDRMQTVGALMRPELRYGMAR